MPLMTFLIGFVLLCGWFLALGSDRRALALLQQAARLILLPLLFLAAFHILLGFLAGALAGLNPTKPHWLVPVAMGLVIPTVIEEAIKLRASRRLSNGNDVFVVVVLFGVFEIALLKPLNMIGTEVSLATQTFLMPAVALHALTAAIYAYFLRDRPGVQFALCLGIHLAFNWAAMRVGGVPEWPWAVIPLVLLTLAMVRNKRPFEQAR